MSFLSYHTAYYEEKINSLERFGTVADVFYAKRLLKFVLDIRDEGYPALAEQVEEKFRGISRLETFILSEGEEPYPTGKKSAPEDSFAATVCPLLPFLEQIRTEAQTAEPTAENTDFLRQIAAFTDSLPHADDTATVFLLRDTLLPYLRFTRGKKADAYPWILSRKMMAERTERDGDDTLVRSVVNDALEAGAADSFENLTAFCLPRIRENLNRFPAFRDQIRSLLSQIKKPKITVVETGCYGMFPLLLAALDRRVEICMYTTTPMLYSAYRKQIFTYAYENMRDFETLVSSDGLFSYASFDGEGFFVHPTAHPEVRAAALSQIRTFLRLP